MDLGLIFGLLGFVTALASALYSRVQAAETRRQAAVQLNSAMGEQMLKARMGLVRQPILAREYLTANPDMAKVYPDAESLAAVVELRNVIDSFQDVWCLRREAIATDHQWREWCAALIPIARMPRFQAIFANAVERKSFDPDFAREAAALLEGRFPRDPLGRVR